MQIYYINTKLLQYFKNCIYKENWYIILSSARFRQRHMIKEVTEKLDIVGELRF